MDDQIKQKINQYLSDIKNGDINSLNLLFEMVGNHLAVIAHVYLNDKNADWDIVGEAYRRVGNSIGTFDTSRSGYNWLYKIVKNVALSYNKSEARHRTVNIDKMASVIKTESFTEISDGWIDFCTIFDRLDDESKKLFEMKFLQDMPQKAIAHKLKITESAVSQRVSKLLQNLEEQLKKN